MDAEKHVLTDVPVIEISLEADANPEADVLEISTIAGEVVTDGEKSKAGKKQAKAPSAKLLSQYSQGLKPARVCLPLRNCSSTERRYRFRRIHCHTATTRVVVRILIELYVAVYLSLWDEAASIFRGLLKTWDKSQSVMLVTTVDAKLFGVLKHFPSKT